MSRRRHTLTLTKAQRRTLQLFLQRPGLAQRQINRAQTLRHWDAGLAAADSAALLGMTEGRVYALRRAYARQGLQAYLNAPPQGGAPTKLTPRVKSAIAQLVTAPTESGWTSVRLARHLVARGFTPAISPVTVWKALHALRQPAE